MYIYIYICRAEAEGSPEANCNLIVWIWRMLILYCVLQCFLPSLESALSLYIYIRRDIQIYDHVIPMSLGITGYLSSHDGNAIRICNFFNHVNQYYMGLSNHGEWAAIYDHQVMGKMMIQPCNMGWNVVITGN